MRDAAELPPPWLRYPDMRAGAIGWRMGSGEDYLKAWWNWAEQLPQPERQDYLMRQRPIPADWMLWATEAYAWPADDDEALDRAWEALHTGASK